MLFILFDHDIEICASCIKLVFFEKISELMKAKGYYQHYAKNFRIGLKTEEKWVFKNRNLVLETLLCMRKGKHG